MNEVKVTAKTDAKPVAMLYRIFNPETGRFCPNYFKAVKPVWPAGRGKVFTGFTSVVNFLVRIRDAKKAFNAWQLEETTVFDGGQVNSKMIPMSAITLPERADA